MTDRKWKEYEQKHERIREENRPLLADFEKWLSEKGLAASTIQRHVENVDFYVDSYLLDSEGLPAREGAGCVSMYLGYWFIRKALWSSASSIKQNAVSLKKFYTFLHERGDVPAEDVEDVKETIKDGMPEWIATLERYDDPDVKDPREIWDL